MKKDANGGIVLKDNFFLHYFWRTNFWRFLILKTIGWNQTDCDPLYPKNLCSLFWGSVLAAPLCWIFTILAAILSLLFVVAIYTVVYLAVVPIGFFFGYAVVLRPKKYQYHHRSELFEFHPYRHYGHKNEKRMPVAPWQILLPALLIWVLVKKNFLVAKAIIEFFARLFSQPAGFIISGGIIAVILLVFLLRSTAGKICLEFFKATKKKICPLITIEK